MERYSRHNLIDWFSQERVSRQSICVVGAGAVGNEVIKSLTLLGVGKIEIIDFDLIEEHNLTKSVLFRPEDVGKSKAEVAALRASELDPNVVIGYRHGDVTALLSITNARGFDCIISCVDNFEARLRINELCKIARIDFINLGIDSRYASVEAFPFSKEGELPCYECNLPPSVYGRIFERYSCGQLKKISYEENKIPTTIVTSGLAGSLGASVALRLGLGETAVSRRILLDSIQGYSSVTTDIAKSPECPCCSQVSGKYTFLAVSRNGQPGPVLNALAGDSEILEAPLRLSEPVVQSARCAKCGSSPYGGLLVGRAKRDINETARYCSNCSSASVDVVLQDELVAREFLDIFSNRVIPVSYATTTIGNRSYCISFEGAL